MAKNGAKVSTPYLGNSTTAKTTLPPFASISHAYAVRSADTSQLSPVKPDRSDSKKNREKGGSMTIYICTDHDGTHR
jgi:hypothetical protein